MIVKVIIIKNYSNILLTTMIHTMETELRLVFIVSTSQAIISQKGKT